MRAIFLMLAFLFFSSFVNAEIYKWVDENGRKHFSDKPQNAEAEYYVPKTGSSSFEGGIDQESFGKTPLKSQRKKQSRGFTNNKQKKPKEKYITKKEQKKLDELEKKRKEDQRGKIRATPEYQKALRKKRRENKALRKDPYDPRHHRSSLTPEDERLLSRGRDNSEFEKLYEKANKK